MSWLRSLAALALVAWAATASAQPTLVGTAGNVCAATSCQVSSGITAAAGDLVVAVVAVRAASAELTVSASDATNGAYTCPTGANIFDGTTSVQAAACYILSSGGASIQPTISVSGGTVNSLVVAALVANDATWSLDQLNESLFTAGTGPHSHGSITTAATNGIVVAVAGQSSAVTDETAASGFTQWQNQNVREYFQYRLTTGSVTTSADYTAVTSHDGAGAIISFSSTGGGGATTCRGLLLGVGVCGE